MQQLAEGNIELKPVKKIKKKITKVKTKTKDTKKYLTNHNNNYPSTK